MHHGRKNLTRSARQLQRTGIVVVPYNGPRIRVAPTWGLGLICLVLGTFAIMARAQRRGRDPSLWTPAVIYLSIATCVTFIIVMQVRRLRGDVGRDGLTLLGWGCGGVKRITALSGRDGAGWRSAVGAPVVGVFASTRGTLFILVDQRGVGLVEADGRRFTASIGHRDGLHWIVLKDGTERVALRLFGGRLE